MSKFMDRAFSEGSWLTSGRVRAIAWLSGLATVTALLFLFGTADGTLDRFGRPLGTDFSNVWTAGRMALDGRAAEAWSWNAHHTVQQATHGRADVPFYGWHYPPPFLLVAAALATLPYLWALAAYQAATLAAVALLARRIVPGPGTLPVILGAPVVLVCLGHGHNGFLTAALLGGGLAILERRPLIAGLLLGCLVYKPQFALLVPPLLLVGGHWRAIAGAAASSGLLIAATLAIWGWPVWQAFIDWLPLTQGVVIEAGATGWHKIASPFAAMRMWGGGIEAAYGVQATATVLAVVAALWIARASTPALRGAAACAAALVATPYVLDYDLVVLGVGAAFLFADGRARGFLRWERTGIALVWAAPLFARQVAEATLLPLGLAAVLTVLLLGLRRAAVLDGAFRSSPFRRSRAASAP
jgi:hypothetical protein